MLSKIKQLFAKKEQQSDQEKVAEEHLATAALLIEVMVIDGHMDDQELQSISAVSYTHLRAHETKANLVCRLLLEKKKKKNNKNQQNNYNNKR